MKSKFDTIISAIILVLIGVVLLTPTTVKAGKESHAGDLVYCTRSSENDFEGYYSLDYVVGRIQLAKPYPIDEKIAGIGDLEKISQVLNTLLPPNSSLATQNEAVISSWKEFLETKSNQEDFSKKRIWLPSTYGLTNIDGVSLKTVVPPNCLKDTENQKPHVIRAVNRENSKDSIIYSFSEKVLDVLKEERPLQYSFLMVHEWLWDYFEDARLLQITNWILHSAITQPAKADSMIKQFVALGWLSNRPDIKAIIPVSIELLSALIQNKPEIARDALRRGASWDILVGFSNAGLPSVDMRGGDGVIREEKVLAEMKEWIREKSNDITWSASYGKLFENYPWRPLRISEIGVIFGRSDIILEHAEEIAKADPEGFMVLLDASVAMNQFDLLFAMAPAWKQVKIPSKTLVHLGMYYYYYSTRDWPEHTDISTINRLVDVFGHILPQEVEARFALEKRDLGRIREIINEDFIFSLALAGTTVDLPNKRIELQQNTEGFLKEWIPQAPATALYRAVVEQDVDFAREFVLTFKTALKTEMLRTHSGTFSVVEVQGGESRRTIEMTTPLEFAKALKKELPEAQTSKIDELIEILKAVF